MTERPSRQDIQDLIGFYSEEPYIPPEPRLGEAPTDTQPTSELSRRLPILAEMIPNKEWQETEYKQTRTKRIAAMIGSAAVGLGTIGGAGIALAEQSPGIAGVLALAGVASYSTTLAFGIKFQRERDAYYEKRSQQS